MRVEVRNQQEFAAAAAKSGADDICILGDAVIEVRTRREVTVTAYGSSTVTAYDSSTVTACGSSTVRAYDSSTVTAYDSSTVRAYDSSTVRAYGSSTVTAYDSSTVTAYDSSTVTAYGYAVVRVLSAIRLTAAATCVVLVHVSGAQIEGGQRIQCPAPATAEAWCNHYGVEIEDGCARIYKALNDDFTSPHGVSYAPGTTPVAADWDGGECECGGGLHFSPTPGHALSFHPQAKRFAACLVSLADIAVHPDGAYPEKVKARAVAKPCIEVDIHGREIA